MANVALDFDSLFSGIAQQFEFVKNNALAPGLDGFGLVIEQERQFAKRKDYSPKTIYLIVSFGNASLNFGQSVLPVSVTCISEENSFSASRDLMMAFATAYNLNSNGGVIQVWNAPTVTSRFNEVASGFRATLSMIGSFVVSGSTGDGVKKIEWYDGDDPIGISILSFRDSFQNSIAPQPFPDSNGFARSVSHFATYTLTFTTYMGSSSSGPQAPFFLLMKRIKYLGNMEDTAFKFRITYDDGTEYVVDNMRVVSITYAQNLGANGSMEVSFSR